MRRGAHWRVAKVAKELVGAQYEELAKDDTFFKLHPDPKAFIAAHWPKYLGFARKALAYALQSAALNEREKIEIQDALIKDNIFVQRAEPRKLIRIGA